MDSMWLPLQWFIRVFKLVIDIEFFPNITLGSISLALLAIVLIFRMIIFPLTGGSVLSIHSGGRSHRKKERSDRGDF